MKKGNHYPTVRFYFDPATDIKNAIGFVSYCLSHGKKSHAFKFLPDDIKYILGKKYSAKDKARVIKQYAKTYYASKDKSLRSSFKNTKADWRGVGSKYFKLVDKLFKTHPWPKGNYRGFGTIFWMYPRFIDEKVFYFPLNHNLPHYARKTTSTIFWPSSATTTPLRPRAKAVPFSFTLRDPVMPRRLAALH